MSTINLDTNAGATLTAAVTGAVAELQVLATQIGGAAGASLTALATTLSTAASSSRTVQRNRLPDHLLRGFDQAASAIEAAKASIAQWMRPLITMNAPTTFSGAVICNSFGQSGLTYTVSGPSKDANGNLVPTTLEIDSRDAKALESAGWTTT